MANREDGKKTREKLLKAASEVFSTKGYWNATIAEICRKAGSNVAAVNYHFGSKDALYMAVWNNAFDQATRIYPLDGGISPDAPAEEHLRALIHSNVHRVLDAGELGYAGQILLKEMSEPTDVLRSVLRNAIQPLREQMRKIITQLLGSKAGDLEIGFCEMSVISQFLALGFRRGSLTSSLVKNKGKLTTEYIDALVEHITRFSLAGIKVVRENVRFSKI